MSVQRMAAHPLVVAVALGLLGPDALTTLPDAPAREGRTEESLEGFGLDDGLTEAPRDIDPEDFARVEREWYEARDLKV